MPLEVVAQHVSPRLSPMALVLVVLAHLGALLTLASMRIAPQEMPSSVLLVEVLRASPDAAKSPEVKPVRPEITPPKPAALAPRNHAMSPSAAPVLASESPVATTAPEEAKAEKSPVSPTVPQATPAPARAVAAAAEPSVPRFDADYLQNPAPTYPPLSRRAGEEGKVVLKVYVEAGGLASKVAIHQGSGFERLDKSAVAAVSRWKFVPARQGPQALAAWVLVPIVFSLKG